MDSSRNTCNMSVSSKFTQICVVTCSVSQQCMTTELLYWSGIISQLLQFYAHNRCANYTWPETYQVLCFRCECQCCLRITCEWHNHLTIYYITQSFAHRIYRTDELTHPLGAFFSCFRKCWNNFHLWHVNDKRRIPFDQKWLDTMLQLVWISSVECNLALAAWLFKCFKTRCSIVWCLLC